MLLRSSVGGDFCKAFCDESAAAKSSARAEAASTAQATTAFVPPSNAWLHVLFAGTAQTASYSDQPHYLRKARRRMR
jgi:hypothetical protein